MKKFRRIFKFVFMFLFIISIIGITSVFAGNVTLKITNVEVKEKSDTVDVNNVSLDGEEIINDISLLNQDDYIIYNITIKNDSKYPVDIKEITDDNDSPYLKYEYDKYSSYRIEKGESINLELKITYIEEVEDLHIQLKKLNLKILYEDNNKNPKTKDTIIKYFVILGVSVLYLGYEYKGKLKKLRVLLLLFLLPVLVNAKENTFTIVLSNDIKVHEYTVTFDSDKGKNNLMVKVFKNGKVSQPEDPEKTGFTFSEWQVKVGMAQYETFNFDTKIIKDTTIEAKWTENPGVTFRFVNYVSDGIIVKTFKIADGEKVPILEKPIKENYLFTGWYYQESIQDPQRPVLYDFELPVHDSFYLDAGWVEDPEVKRVNVTFDSDGGSPVASQRILANTKVDRPYNPEKEYFKLDWWDLDNEKFDFDTLVNQDITLKAHWGKDLINYPREEIIYFLDDAEEELYENQEYLSGVDIPHAPVPPTKDDYTFVGWFEHFINGDDPVKFVFDGTTKINRSYRLRAHWNYTPEVQYYLVEFDSRQGTSVPNQYIASGERAYKPEDPTSDAGEFLGWYLEIGDVLSDTTYDFSTPITTDIRLVAKFGHLCGTHPVIEGTYKDTFTFKYSDCFFEDSPITYNSSMATTSTEFSYATETYIDEENTSNPYHNSSKNVVSVLEQSGFSNLYIPNDYKIKPTADTTGFVIGSKDVHLERGDESVVAIVIRSIGYEKEWISNLTVGPSGEASGFSTAATKVYNALKTYIDTNYSTEVANGKLNIWISGYSRGGAIANIVAKRIIDDYQDISGSVHNRIYAYCSEPAQGGDSTLVLDENKYYSIHNIVNPDDLVTYVIPQGMDIRRYGVDHYIFDDVHTWIVKEGNNNTDNANVYVASPERVDLVNKQLERVMDYQEGWEKYKPYTIKSKHVDVTSFAVVDAQTSEYTSAFLNRFFTRIVKDVNGNDVITRSYYIDEGMQDEMRRLMDFVQSDVKLGEFVEKIGLADALIGGGPTAIVAAFGALTNVDYVDGLRLSLNNAPITRYFLAESVRNTIESNWEALIYLDSWEGGRQQALADIQDIVYHLLKSCDYVDDFVTLVLNIGDIFTNHEFPTTIAWLRSFDPWYN